ncbi:MAG: hypothetical protein EAZ89_08800 [Bacteroidetes bacterium]|jgi:hypothetical protein|nr:MAG: hypothetical protein EAZ89_08800 [Bacteroidota bacterium]
MKSLLFLLICASFALVLNACTTAYVRTEPEYRETVRPPRPFENHVWVGDNWRWNYRNHSYTRREGHWQQPSRGRNYTDGHWTSTPRGRYWVHGQWKR